ncbi:MAG: hypothetical protein LBI20_03790 [Holosporales bacterium]|jgi:hypothetical protein|nr:hypothetical protein [Holosporales bacterium]
MKKILILALTFGILLPAAQSTNSTYDQMKSVLESGDFSTPVELMIATGYPARETALTESFWNFAAKWNLMRTFTNEKIGCSTCFHITEKLLEFKIASQHTFWAFELLFRDFGGTSLSRIDQQLTWRDAAEMPRLTIQQQALIADIMPPNLRTFQYTLIWRYIRAALTAANQDIGPQLPVFCDIVRQIRLEGICGNG